MSLYNRKAVRQFINDTAPGIQIEKSVWPALEFKIRKMISVAIRTNRNFKRLTSSEFGIPRSIEKRVDKENNST